MTNSKFVRVLSFSFCIFSLFSLTAYAAESNSSNFISSLSSLLDREPGHKVSIGPFVDWKLTPGFTYDTKYDSNINRSPAGYRNDDVIMSYAPSIELSRDTEAFMFKSKYTFEYQDYLEHSWENAFNHRVDNALRFKKGRFTFKAEDNFGDVKDIASSEQSERQRVVYNYLNTELITKLTDKISVSGIYRNNLFRYNSSVLKQFSWDQNEFGGRAYYHVTPKFDLYMQGLGDFIEYYRGGSYNSKGASADLGAVGTISNKLIVNVETGFRARDYHSKDIKDYYNYTLKGVIKYQITPKIAFSLKGMRDIQPSIYETMGWYSTTMGGFGMEFKLTQKMMVTAGASYANNHYPSQTDRGDGTWHKRDDNFAIVDVGYKWDIYKTISYRLYYRYETRQSNFNDFDYNDHIVGTALDIKC